MSRALAPYRRAAAVAALSLEPLAGEPLTRPRPSSLRYYVKVMTKGQNDDAFVGKEADRLKKMMDDASVKPNKKEQFGRRLNILSSFQ